DQANQTTPAKRHQNAAARWWQRLVGGGKIVEQARQRHRNRHARHRRRRAHSGRSGRQVKRPASIDGLGRLTVGEQALLVEIDKVAEDAGGFLEVDIFVFLSVLVGALVLILILFRIAILF